MAGVILLTAMLAGGISLWLKRRKLEKESDESLEHDVSEDIYYNAVSNIEICDWENFGFCSLDILSVDSTDPGIPELFNFIQEIGNIKIKDN